MAAPPSSPLPPASPPAFSQHSAAERSLAVRNDDLDAARSQWEAAWLDPLDASAVGPAAPADDLAATRRRVLDFCGRHPDALHRSCHHGHLTGSALVLDPDGERTLLIHHAKLDRWLQPGGHADGDGNLAAVALREATEETGIAGLAVLTPAVDADIHEIPARPGEPEHLHLDLRFAVIAPTDAVVAHNHEALDARWVTVDDPLVAGGELERAIRRAQAALRHHRG